VNFTLPAKARPFFRTVTERTPKWLLFDSWYVCMLVGLRDRTLGSKDELEDTYFFDAYPEDFKPQADFIAGLLIDAELDRNGIDVENKASVEKEMILLLDPSRSTGLSETGLELLNRYAVGGFARIEEAMLPPANVEDLMVKFAEIWGDGDDS
jgi:hypothetical protein